MAPCPLCHALPQARLRAVLHRQVLKKPPEVLGQFVGGAMTTVRIGIQALTGESVQAPGHLGTPGAKRRHRPVSPILDHEPDGLHRRQSGWKLRERRLAGDHLEED